MPAPVVIVHTDSEFRSAVETLLTRSGYRVASFSLPLKALDAIDADGSLQVLVTRVQFPEGQPHGIALARMVLVRKPAAKVVFTTSDEYSDHIDGVGTVLTAPVTPADVLAAIRAVGLEPG